MRRTTLAAAIAAAGLAIAALQTSSATAAGSHPTRQGSSAPAQFGFSVRTLDFHVAVPNESGGAGTQECIIVGDLYKPAGASPRHRVPVILTTNGFGGSKNDQSSLARFAARHGYGVLSYSGLGFGGSGCKISLDDPSYDGRAGSQLVSFLGGKAGIATTLSGAKVPPVRWIRHDRRDHLGHHRRYDPRVGMIGGSYGGEIQFAVAADDPRVDAIVPIITWNNLTYSLAPNNGALTRGVTYDLAAPGSLKLEWSLLLFSDGLVDGISGFKNDPSRDFAGCADFLPAVCTLAVETGANAVYTKQVDDFLRHASVVTYMRRIRIPTLLMQGQGDSLFNLQEAVANYRSLRRQHTPVKMIWQSWGHSIPTAQPGEWTQGAGFLKTYEGQRVFAWFERYLKGRHVSTGPRFAYYRDWVPFNGKGPDTVQYASAKHFPVGHIKTFFASGTSSLVSHRATVRSGSETYANLSGATPLSYSELSGAQSSLPSQATKPFDTPGTFAAWESAPLTHRLDVAGIPTAVLHVTSPGSSAAVAATELELFAKIYDVTPNGTIDLVRRLVAPVRVLDDSRPVRVTLPGIVHRFAKGDRIELVIAATDSAYRNSDAVQPSTVSTSRTAPTLLRLPIVK